MRPPPSAERATQLKLFHPPAKGPGWEELPHEIRQQSVRLLARLLYESWARTHRADLAKEAHDD